MKEKTGKTHSEKAPGRTREVSKSPVHKQGYLPFPNSPVQEMLFFQRNLGNRVLQRMMRSSSVRRKGSLELDSNIASRIEARRGSGQPLVSNIQQRMEDTFGQDLSQVRVHSDAEARGLVREVGAKAFTRGEDIFFGDGAHDPSTFAGEALLTHELTHVVQQKGVVAGPPTRVTDPSESGEREADAMAKGQMGRKDVSIAPRPEMAGAIACVWPQNEAAQRAVIRQALTRWSPVLPQLDDVMQELQSRSPNWQRIESQLAAAESQTGPSSYEDLPPAHMGAPRNASRQIPRALAAARSIHQRGANIPGMLNSLVQRLSNPRRSRYLRGRDRTEVLRLLGRAHGRVAAARPDYAAALPPCRQALGHLERLARHPSNRSDSNLDSARRELDHAIVALQAWVSWSTPRTRGDALNYLLNLTRPARRDVEQTLDSLRQLQVVLGP